LTAVLLALPLSIRQRRATLFMRVVFSLKKMYIKKERRMYY